MRESNSTMRPNAGPYPAIALPKDKRVVALMGAVDRRPSS
jgi:hypothetical protein